MSDLVDAADVEMIEPNIVQLAFEGLKRVLESSEKRRQEQGKMALEDLDDEESAAAAEEVECDEELFDQASKLR